MKPLITQILKKAITQMQKDIFHPICEIFMESA